MNTILTKALEVIRSHTATVQEEVSKLESERAKLQREQVILQNAPRTRDDVIADIGRVVDMCRDEYTQRFTAKVVGNAGAPSRWMSPHFRLSSPIVEVQSPSINLFALQRANELIQPTPIYLECMIGLLGDAIKPAVRGMLQQVDWPKDAISAQERGPKLAEIERKIEDINQKISALLNEAREAGMDV